MAELLLINPARPIRKGKKMARKTRRKAPSAKQRANWARFAAMARSRAKTKRAGGKRRAARTTVASARRRARNPIVASRRRARRRNPINLGGATRGLMAQFKDALLGGAGSVAMDVAYGQIARFLPASLQRTPAGVGLGDAAKAVITVVLGNMLAGPTRGLSRKMAAGALTVQSAELMRRFVPASLTLGYYNPARVVQGTPRVGPIRPGMNAYTRGAPPMLNAYVQGATPLLNGAGQAPSVQRREGVSTYY